MSSGRIIPLKRGRMGTMQGIYVPANPEKYIGEGDIRLRSSWEMTFARMCDDDPNVICWNSEGMVIPYIKPSTGRQHKYYMDFVVRRKVNGVVKDFAIEIKPHAERKMPRKPRKKTAKALANYQRKIVTYETNMAKWNFANIYCKKRGIIFMIMDEYDLKLKTKPESRK